MLTGGGDCPGLNAVMRAATIKMVSEYGFEVVGARRGWKGMVEGDFVPMDLQSISGILHKGGTIIGTSRTNPYKEENGVERLKESMEKNGIWAIIGIGGDDTLGAADKLVKEHGLNIVGVPKTIDNDLSATDYTFGFDTAVGIATEQIDRLHSTAESHDRTIVVEVMGRHTGWIAIMSGIAGGADYILIPEVPTTVEDVCESLQRRHDERGKNFNIVVASEGAKMLTREGGEQLLTISDKVDAFGNVQLGGIGEALAGEIEARTGFETRATVLGHIQRGGTPSAHDRILSTRFGLKAAEMVKEEKFGFMAALQGDDIVEAPLADAVGERKMVPMELWDIAKTFFS
ncbi:MAG: ATP-dependent 6-phosphofructokinase [Gaiellales bacterium]|nr:MAG: ATP-dependent 6-phosphofructokinase [Gaiellales bacterium]